MAGIGQFTMGRTMMHDLSKPITNISGTLGKRALFGSGATGSVAPSFSDVANLCASGYAPRPGSQQNGELLNPLSGGNSVRSPFSATSPDNNTDSFFNAVGFNGGPARNYSEPALFPSLSTASRTVGADAPNSRLGSNAVKPLNEGTNLNVRNAANYFPSPLTGESMASTSINIGSSRGIKLDPSDFPPILTSSGRNGSSAVSGTLSTSNQTPLRNYVSVMSKGSDTSVPGLNTAYGSTSSSQNPPEFSKQDFPALPGQHTSATTVTTASSTASLSGLHRPVSLNPPTSCLNTGALNSQRSFTQGSSSMLSLPSGGFPSVSTNGTTSGIQLLPNHLVANIPKNMICDQFGMLGLLKLIRVGDYDSTLNMLAPGLDLSSLHNNWQTSGELHTTFVSPCHESCIGRPHDMDYAVPPEYLIRHLITDRLPDPPMDQLSEETLFWLFYNCCREEVQLVVAKELYQREWRFHKKEQIWLTRVMGANFTTDNNSEQGDYYFWDPIKAQKSTHQMTILYADLDDAPSTFRLSSNTLSAFVTPAINPLSVSLPAAQHQLAAYQQQSLLHRQQMLSGSSSQQQQQSTPHFMMGGNPAQASAATLASLLSARQQKQLSPTATNYFPSPNPLSRSVAVTPLFGGRPNPATTMVSSIGTPVSSTPGSLVVAGNTPVDGGSAALSRAADADAFETTAQS